MEKIFKRRTRQFAGVYSDETDESRLRKEIMKQLNKKYSNLKIKKKKGNTSDVITISEEENKNIHVGIWIDEIRELQLEHGNNNIELTVSKENKKLFPVISYAKINNIKLILE